MHRGLKYAGMRAASNVVLRDVNTSLVIEEMYRGATVIYMDFTDYDEIAHHSGPERIEALQALDGVDGAIATLVKAAEDAPRPYRFVVLSDHGQSLGATFLQRYGKTLGEVVRDLMGGRATVVETRGRGRGLGVRQLDAVRGHPRRGRQRRRRPRGAREPDRRTASSTSTTRTVAAAGRRVDDRRRRAPATSASSTSPGYEHRLTLEELEEKQPGPDREAVRPPGHRPAHGPLGTRGAVVLGRAACATSTATGRSDRGRGPDAAVRAAHADSLRREDAMLHAPDILALSQFDPELGEVAAFEELIGSHGGLGG